MKFHTVLFVNASIGFSENLFLVIFVLQPVVLFMRELTEGNKISNFMHFNDWFLILPATFLTKEVHLSESNTKSSKVVFIISVPKISTYVC